MKRGFIFVYGVLSYAFALATFLYAIGFIGNFVVPKSMDSAPSHPLIASLLIDLGLLTLFAAQHSGMAHPVFKRWLARYIPAEAERGTYLLLSTACVALLFWLWAPLGGVVWYFSSQWAQYTLYSLYFASWALLVCATFLVNHFHLFGLRQSYYALLGIFWFTPTMSETHLVFAVFASLYILVGIRFEERDLEHEHPGYWEYNRKISRNGSALIPSLTRRLSSKSQAQRV